MCMGAMLVCAIICGVVDMRLCIVVCGGGVGWNGCVCGAVCSVLTRGGGPRGPATLWFLNIG